MTESYLTTDIIVIIVLVVVLVLVGVCAFFTHFYWTKIGVSEIWNTAKWSSMRSSVYHTMRRLSRASSSKYGSERPFSAASAYSEDSDGSALPAPLRNKKPNTNANPNTPSPVPPPPPPPSQPPDIHSSTPVTNDNNNVRRNSRNQVQPVSTIAYNNTGRKNYGIKIGQPLESTQIRNVHENDDKNNGITPTIETHRF
ncbi:unnamed protein product [Adineta steineri]|uniref:Uncharacterized protein n=1 Tax=Adineta steineri TaxID=433720 RepID=A0A819SRK6_9BILA|nr:unnamed protein product [Adineta steineri]CAF1267692.1 unnamed protein product [Adineta steineri]CAF3901815.1 unnamed protein product [Adineta steineri]CAF4075786.1 unnamed protein product [Adineta steineri]